MVIIIDDANEAANVVGTGGNIGDREAARDETVDLDVADEAARASVVRSAGGHDGRAHDGAVGHGRVLGAAREGADVAAAAHGRVRDAEVGDSRIRAAGPEVPEEAHVVGGVGGHGQVGDDVATPVERTGELMEAIADRRPGLAREIDVATELVGTGEVIGDGGEFGARGNARGREGGGCAREHRGEGQHLLHGIVPFKCLLEVACFFRRVL